MKFTKTIEFNYDGGAHEEWAVNGGSLITQREVISMIGREIFYEAMKLGYESFKVTFVSDVTLEPL